MEKTQLMSGVMVDIKLGHVNLFCLDYKHEKIGILIFAMLLFVPASATCEYIET